MGDVAHDDHDKMASVAVFCPQSKSPAGSYLDQLHAFLKRCKHAEPFLEEICALPEVWNTFADAREEIAALEQGPRYLNNLAEWVRTGRSSLIEGVMSGINSLPLLVIIQLGQYLQFLELQNISHADFIAQLREGGGAQGYCGGLPVAVAIAVSKNEAELAKHAAVAMRITMGIGAYGELGDDGTVPGSTTIVVRLRKIGQGEALVSKFPGAYVSAITDPKTISIVGPVHVLKEIQAYCRSQGLLVQEMHIRGKVHNPENADFAKELTAICERTECLQLPEAEQLQANVRSNRTGETIRHGSLVEEIVQTILASRCEWFALLNGVAEDLLQTGRRAHSFAMFGIGDCVPLSPFHKAHLQITKSDILAFINESVPALLPPQVDSQYSFPDDAVAIVGASCRLPGVNDIEELWELIASGQSQHREVPADRFDIRGSFRASQDPKFAGKKTFYGNFIDGAENFDHTFFGTNPKEAMNMDPQQRVLLELAYQAMESSGYMNSHRRENGDPIGCFIGASFTEYLENTACHPPTAYTSTGTIRAFLCGKLSYYFGWSGPAEVIDTACSSSLVAVNRAVKAVQQGECPMALTGGVNVITGIQNYMDLGKAGFLSASGQCKPFDSSADGYCRADGAGLIVVKRLNEAIANGDHIMGVIPGVSTNQGGLSASITVPHSPAQIQLYKNVLRQSNMKPEQVSYIEAHGTGTQAGDPLEVASIREVFGGPQRTDLLNLGSLKGNVGHSETAAGVAGLIKVLSMIRKRSVPPLASHTSLNPKIPPLETDKMNIPKSVGRWDAPLLASLVNSYGAAGSNAALICCEGPRPSEKTSGDAARPSAPVKFPFMLSASSKESLRAYAMKLEQHLRHTIPKPSIGDLSFTLSERRKHLRYRFVTAATDLSALTESLKIDVDRLCVEAPHARRQVVLAFGGQSKQIIGLDEKLYKAYPQFKSYIDSCDKLVKKYGFPSFLPSLFQTEPISDVIVLQCGTFAVQYACAKCWMDAGVQVDAVIGHSFGELTAMVVSEALSLEDGIRLIACRALLMSTKWGSESGTMLAVHARREVVRDLVSRVNNHAGDGALEIACYNAPTSQVVVGKASTIDRAESILKEESRFHGVRHQRLDTTHGFHSQFVDPLLDSLNEFSDSLTFNTPKIPLETCTQTQINSLSANRPSQHAREPVYFVDAVQRIESKVGSAVWLEAGINSPIIPMIKRAVSIPEDHSFQALSLKDSRGAHNLLSDAVTNLWLEGILTSYWSFLPPKGHGFSQVWLPPYQFQRTAHWLPHIDRVMEVQQRSPTSVSSGEEQLRPQEPARLITPKSISPSGKQQEFEIHVGTNRFKDIVSGHAVRQRPLCPASMYMECAAMALQYIHPDAEPGFLYFEDLNFQAALGVDLTRDVSLVLEETRGGLSWNFVVKSISRTDAKPRLTTHADGKIGLARANLKTYERLISDRLGDLERKPNTEKLMSYRAYGLFSQVVHYADFLQGIHQIILDGTQAMADIDYSKAAAIASEESTVIQHCDTVAIDTFIQVVGLLINSSNMVSSNEVFVATGVDSVTIGPNCNLEQTKNWTVYTKYSSSADNQATGDVFVFSKDNKLVMTIMGVRFTKLQISKLEKFLDSANAKPSAKFLNDPVGRVRVNPTPSTTPAATPSHTPYATPLATPVATPIPSPGISPSPGSSNDSLGNDADVSPHITRNSSMTSVCDIGTPPSEPEGGLEDLKDLICTYTGLTAAEIVPDVSMADLGVDSLAAVELAEEIHTRFGKEVVSDNLLPSTYADLSKLLVPAGGQQKPKPQKLDFSLPSPVNSFAPPPSAGLTPQPSAQRQNASRRNEVIEMIAESSGADPAEIKEGATLQDLGVDSLSAVELKSDIETAFDIEIPDDALSLESSVKDVLQYLGCNESPGFSFIPPSPDPRSTNTSSRQQTPTMQQGEFSSNVKRSATLANPMDALSQFATTFDKHAEKRGVLNYWSNVAPSQDELLLAYLSEGFRGLGVNLDNLSEGQKLPQVQYLPKHEKVMQRFFEIFEKHGVLKRRGNDYIRGDRELPGMSSEELNDEFVERYPSFKGEAELMQLTGPKLAACLNGKADPVGLMFKSSASQKVMENYYCRSPMLATLTEQLVEFMRVVATQSRTAQDAPIKILEVGAGFGGTTTRLAELFKDLRVPVEYTFTDISPTLVNSTKSRFSSYPWMKFQTFNLEANVPDSMRDSYDIVLGTNCVHATKSKTASLDRLRQVLSPQGFIVLSEVTQIIDWYDIVFGLLDGWWLADNGKTYPLQPPESWMQSFKEAGLPSASFSQGSTPESNTQRLLVGSKKEVSIPPSILPVPAKAQGRKAMETVTYKRIDGTDILADVYYPEKAPEKPMPIALMIHGGGHMTLSKKAVRPAQTQFLLSQGILPVSIDYRLCPEVNMLDGPIADVRDAYAWAQHGLQDVVRSRGIKINGNKIVVIGWSTGGQLAMTTAWTTKQAGLKKPEAVLAFYCPTDFESGDLDVRRAEMYPERRMTMERIVKALPKRAITSYDSDVVDTTGLGWVRPGDPRSELVLSLFKEGNGLPLMLNGLSDPDGWRKQPDPARVAAISPMAQLKAGNYDVPTYIIHGERDEIVPFHTATKFVDALRSHGVQHGFLPIKAARHIHDLALKPGTEKWRQQVLPGYEFLFDILSRGR